jgi:GntR family transcriptional regulator / MocR family aminotransferase
MDHRGRLRQRVPLLRDAHRISAGPGPWLSRDLYRDLQQDLVPIVADRVHGHPTGLVDRFVAVRHAMDVYPPHLYQAVLADFINQGHLSRHIRRTRLVYGDRRKALVDAVRQEFGSRLQIVGADAGMHLVAMLDQSRVDREISMRAARENLWLSPLSPCYLGKGPRQGFILGFGSTSVREIPKRIRQLRKVIAAS